MKDAQDLEWVEMVSRRVSKGRSDLEDRVNCLVGACHLQLALSFLRHLDHHFAPSVARSKCLQRFGNRLQSDKLLVCITRSAELATVHQVEQALPYHFDHFWLICSIRTPVQSHDADILQQNSVGGHLFNISSCKPDDQKSSIPSCALHALSNESNRIIDDIDTTTLGSQLLDLIRPVLLSVVDQVICTK
jgi:hypothetical protein